MAQDRSKNREENQAMESQRRGLMSRTDRWMPAPFGLMGRFLHDMDRMFEGFGFPSTETMMFAPRIDVFEREGKLVISADLPGINKDDVKVEITDDSIVLEGERKYEHEQKERGVYRTERGYGHFRRLVPLPPGTKTDTATATFKNGVLEISVEAPQLAKSPRQVQIKEESGDKAA